MVTKSQYLFCTWCLDISNVQRVSNIPTEQLGAGYINTQSQSVMLSLAKPGLITPKMMHFQPVILLNQLHVYVNLPFSFPFETKFITLPLGSDMCDSTTSINIAYTCRHKN